MANKLLNIEVGDYITKITVSLKRKKEQKILSSFMLLTPDGAVSDGQIIDEAILATAIRKQLLLNDGADAKKVIFTLTSGKIASREIMLPLIKENRIKDVVETNASDYFPVDMSGYRVSHSLLERRTGDNPGCRVLVMAAPKQLLDSYVRLAEEMNVLIDSIDYSGNSQYQLLRTIKAEGVVMYVDVNIRNTMVTFMSGEMLLLQRNIPVGGNEIITTALNSIEGDDATYLDALHQIIHPETLNTILTKSQQENSLERLVSGITRSADFFKSERSATPVTSVVLMGCCGHVETLREMVASEIGLPVNLLENVSSVSFPEDSVEGIPSYIACVGSGIAPLKFLPERYQARNKKRDLKRSDGATDFVRIGVTVFIVFAVLSVAYSAWAGISYNRALSEKAELEARKEELAYVEDTFRIYAEYLNTNDMLIKMKDETNALANESLNAFLGELERKMPSSMLLVSATFDNSGVTLNISTPGIEEADVVLSQLRSFESIGSMEVSTITETTTVDTGIVSASFTVTCGYSTAQPAEQD